MKWKVNMILLILQTKDMLVASQALLGMVYAKGVLAHGRPPKTSVADTALGNMTVRHESMLRSISFAGHQYVA